MSKNKEKTYYICWVLENLSRRLYKQKSLLVKEISDWRLNRIYELDDIYHCQSIESVVDELIAEFNLQRGRYNPFAKLSFRTPTTYEIAKTYAYIIDKNYDNDMEGILNVFSNPVVEVLENYNAALYFSDKDFIASCFRVGSVDSVYNELIEEEWYTIEIKKEIKYTLETLTKERLISICQQYINEYELRIWEEFGNYSVGIIGDVLPNEYYAINGKKRIVALESEVEERKEYTWDSNKRKIEYLESLKRQMRNNIYE